MIMHIPIQRTACPIGAELPSVKVHPTSKRALVLAYIPDHFVWIAQNVDPAGGHVRLKRLWLPADDVQAE
jgi:hypothetical protein